MIQAAVGRRKHWLSQNADIYVQKKNQYNAFYTNSTDARFYDEKIPFLFESIVTC
jgi:hypothetical protein